MKRPFLSAGLKIAMGAAAGDFSFGNLRAALTTPALVSLLLALPLSLSLGKIAAASISSSASAVPAGQVTVKDLGMERSAIARPDHTQGILNGAGSTCPRRWSLGIPSLDDMAGDWISLQDVANPPAVHNFNQMLVVDRDLTSFFCNPGKLYPWRHGYPVVKLFIGCKEFPAVETRAYAYRALRRNLDCHGLAVATDTRMVNEQRGVLCRITATNLTAKPLKTTFTLRVPGALQADGVGVENHTQRTNVVSVVRPSRKPDSVTTETNVVCWTWNLELPAAAEVTLGFVAGDEETSQAAQTDARVVAWAAHFDVVMDECKQVWEQRWADAFTPGNAHFSGNLPVLETRDAALARNYYMGALTMLILERTQFPVSPRSFVTSGERADGIQYYWDASMQATAWALLEPAGMKTTLRCWLVQNARSGSVLFITRTNGCDHNYHDQITGYAFNACTIFKTADEYLRVTGDRAFLDEKLEDGKTVLDHLDAFATDWETLPKGPHGLVNYGENRNLLECAPAYIHCVPSLNAQDVWMMRRAAEWHTLHGEAPRAKELQDKAAAFLPAVLGLYKSGAGVWNAYHTNGTLVELRHCVDYIYCGNALENDLTATQKSEMNAFVKRELFMRDWMRAMSLQDAAAANSDRPDHGPLGAYDGWIPLTVGTMWRLGDPVGAYDFYRRTAVVTQEGPFAQAREFYGSNKKDFDAPVRVARRLGCMKECISGVAFADVVLNTFFGFSPSVDGNTLVGDPQTPRPFVGTLTGIRYRGQYFQINASAGGVKTADDQILGKAR